MMVGNNTDPMETAFTISIDLKRAWGDNRHLCQAIEQKTVKALVDPSIKPFDLSRPGHIFPAQGKRGRCTAQNRPHRGSHRLCETGRAQTCWRDCRDNERGWNHGHASENLPKLPESLT